MALPHTPDLDTQLAPTNGSSDSDDTTARFHPSSNQDPEGVIESAREYGLLADESLQNFNSRGDVGELENALRSANRAVDLTPENHLAKPSSLDRLGSIYRVRFDRFGYPEDLNQAILAKKHAIRLVTESHPELPGYLSDLSVIFRIRFQLLGYEEDLEKAIDVAQRAVRLGTDGQPSRLGCIGNLGTVLNVRYQRSGNLEDLSQAVSFIQRAADLTVADHPNKAIWLGNLSLSLCDHFSRTGQLHDLERAIIAGQQAVELLPDDHLDKANFASNLGFAFRLRFERLADPNDAAQAISASQRAIALTPEGHSALPGRLTNLGIALRVRFERTGQLNDLQLAISANELAVGFAPDSHPNKAQYLSLTSAALVTRFVHVGDISDLDKSIALGLRAVDIAPDNHPAKISWLCNLGAVYHTRFQRTDDISDLTQEIDLAQRVIDLAPADHPNLAGFLTNLASALSNRFSRIGDIEDLTKAISLNERIVTLSPSGHRTHIAALNNLGREFQVLFQRTGDVLFITQAISAVQRAVALTPDEFPDKASQLSGLASAFSTRFERSHDVEDAVQAVAAGQKSIAIIVPEHPNMAGFLGNLSVAYSQLSSCTHNPDHLTLAISVSQQAVKLSPDDHPLKPKLLHGLSTLLHAQFKQSGDITDIEKAIESGSRANELIPDRHPIKAASLLALSTALISRYTQLSAPDDLIQGASRGQQAAELLEDDHPDKVGVLHSVGAAYHLSYLRCKDDDHLNRAICFFHAAAHSPSGRPTWRFLAAGRLAELCLIDPTSYPPLPAFEYHLSLIPALAAYYRPIDRRLDDIVEISNAVTFASAVAISFDKSQLAIEWLEMGRGIVWQQIFQLRTPADELRSLHPELAEKLEEIAMDLHLSTSEHRPPEEPLTLVLAPYGSEEGTRRRIQLAKQYEMLLNEIRTLPGFRGFSSPRKFDFSSFSKATQATQTLVVIVNVDAHRCDALAITPSGHVRHTPLPNFSEKLAESMRAQLALSLASGRALRGRIPKELLSVERGSALSRQGSSWRKILGCLWRCVVQPILAAVEDILWEAATDRKPHLVWCPTGALVSLPLHAAGVYIGDGVMSTSDFVVSSYTPSLSAFLRASTSGPTSALPLDVLCVTQRHSPIRLDLPALHGVTEEASVLAARLPGAVSHLEGDQATISAVLAAIKQHAYIHLACHGVQDTKTPTNSAFLLYDGQLTLSDLIAAPPASAEIAFLSACETMVGDRRMPDEAVHLAAGMLAVGYKGVVGTMWAIGDKDAPIVADAFYARLVEDRKSGRVRQGQTGAAYALDEAVRVWREKMSEEDFMRWIPFVHLGV